MHNFSIIVPVYNEEGSIKNLLEEIISINYKYEYEIIIVNDCSNDQTKKIVQDFNYDNIFIINHHKRMGQSKSITDGIIKARYDTIVTLDGDGQNNPLDIVNLLNIYFKFKDVYLVSGIRHKRKDNFIKKISSRAANIIRNYYLKDNCLDTGCSLKVFSRKIFLEMPYFNSIHRFIPALFVGKGHKVIYENVDHRVRIFGKTKYGIYNRLFRGLVDLYKVKKIIESFKND